MHSDCKECNKQRKPSWLIKGDRRTTVQRSVTTHRARSKAYSLGDLWLDVSYTIGCRSKLLAVCGLRYWILIFLQGKALGPVSLNPMVIKSAVICLMIIFSDGTDCNTRFRGPVALYRLWQFDQFDPSTYGNFTAAAARCESKNSRALQVAALSDTFRH